jgi:hypothetical protein
MTETGKVNIHGKTYLTVAFRVDQFRSDHGDWCIATEVLFRDQEVVVMKAIISDEKGNVKATGHSEEKRSASQINKTSALENAETSAIGRALASLGYVGTEFASADEVANAISQQRAGIHKPSDGAMESLEPDMQIHVQDVADEVKLKVVKGDVKGAYEWLQAANLEADAKVACWNLIQPAHIRTAITKYSEGLKASGNTSSRSEN